MTLMTTPTPRVWLATFISLVFAIGVLVGVVVERTWLQRSLAGGPGSQMRSGGQGVPGEPGGRGRGGPGLRVPGSRVPGGGGPGRGGASFGPPPQQYVDDLAKAVQLTDAQRTEVLKLLEAQEARLRTLQEDSRALFIREQQGLHDRIAAALTAEQATAFREWVSRRTGRRGGLGQLR